MFSTTYKVTTSEFKKCVLNVVLCSKNRSYAMKEISRHVVRVTGHIIAAGIFSNYNYTVGYILTCNDHKSWNFCHLIPIIHFWNSRIPYHVWPLILLSYVAFCYCSHYPQQNHSENVCFQFFQFECLK